jgi:hypothetical protein
MTPLDRVIADISAQDPPFSDRIVGTDAASIAALELAAGEVLPPDYRDFLSRMGHSADWLAIEAADFTIDTILPCYAAGQGRSVPGYWLIGKATSDPYADVYLAVENSGRSRVVSFPSPPRGDFSAFARVHLRPVAGSLPQLLALEAFRTFRTSRFSYHRTVRRDVIAHDSLASLDPFVTAAGMNPLWYSNDWVRVYDGRESSAVAYGFPNCAWFATLHAGTTEAIAALERRLAIAQLHQ